MIKNSDALRKFEENLIRAEKPDFYKNLQIVSELHQYARKLGVFGKDLMSENEAVFRVARIINHVRKSS